MLVDFFYVDFSHNHWLDSSNSTGISFLPFKLRVCFLFKVKLQQVGQTFQIAEN